MKTQRDPSLDLLKSCGLALIFLAHSQPPDALFQLRNFDVVLLVVVSAVLSARNPMVTLEDVQTYLKRRFMRLLAPVWLFLAFFILAQFAASRFRGSVFPSVAMVFHAFILDENFVWIIRVFILTSLAIPLLLFGVRHWGAMKVAAVAVVVAALFEVFILELSPPPIFGLGYLKGKCLDYIVPYGLAAAIGVLIPRLRTAAVLACGAFFVVLYVGFSLWESRAHECWISVQAFKYPPHLLYISYGLAWTLLLFAGARALRINPMSRLAGALSFVSRHSLSLYLWHTLFLHWGTYPVLLPLPTDTWWVRWILLILCAGVLLAIQQGVRRIFRNLRRD